MLAWQLGICARLTPEGEEGGGMNTLWRSGVVLEARIHQLLSVGGLDVALLLEAPSTAELFQHHVDLIVVSDYVGFSAFARLVDSSSPSTQGFLPPATLDDISKRFGHRARCPRGLLDLPVKERIQPRNVDRHCSLLHLGVVDRTYAGKFLFFVPSLVYDDCEVPDRYAEDYVECAMYVAAYRRARAVCFAGFGGTDGSFADDTLIKLVDRIHDTRCSVPLPPLRTFFKYFPLAAAERIDRLTARLAAHLHAAANDDAPLLLASDPATKS
jgi:hypothetical protein